MPEAITKNNTENKARTFGLTSFVLHILAMIFMTCDHLWGTDLLGEYTFLTWIGRFTFPIYAFMIAQGYCHTKDFKKYKKRLLIFALISEIPYDLMTESTVFYPFGQNVLWTFILALLCMKSVDKVRENKKPVIGWLLGGLVILGFYLAAQLTMVDYFGEGLLMAVVFYVFRGNKWYNYILQAIGIIFINMEMMKGLVYPVELFGKSFEIPEQAFAIFALIPIFLYNGKQGPKNKFTKYLFYAYYPAHMLVLVAVKWIISNA